MARCPFGVFKQCPQSNQGKGGCAQWVVFSVGNPRELRGDCTHNWQAVFLRDLRIDTNGVQAAVESFRNNVAKQQRVLSRSQTKPLPIPISES